MTTLAANTVRKYLIGPHILFPMVADDILYEGAAAGRNSGVCRPLQAGDPFVGFNRVKADNTGGAAGAIKAELDVEGCVQLSVTGVDGWDDVGTAVYASDDDTFTTSSTGNSLIGVVAAHVSGTTCFVYFNARAQALAAVA
jgi:hypothetical protein